MSSSRKKQPSLDKANIERIITQENESTAYKNTHSLTHSLLQNAQKEFVSKSVIFCALNEIISLAFDWDDIGVFFLSLVSLFVWNCARYCYCCIDSLGFPLLYYICASRFLLLFFCRHQSLPLTSTEFYVSHLVLPKLYRAFNLSSSHTHLAHHTFYDSELLYTKVYSCWFFFSSLFFHSLFNWLACNNCELCRRCTTFRVHKQYC